MSINLLAQNVHVAGVSSGLLDHMNHHISYGQFPISPRDHRVEITLGENLPAECTFDIEQRHDVFDGLVVFDPELLLLGEHLDRPTADHFLKPSPLDMGHVFENAKQRSPGWHHRPGGILSG